MQGVTVLVDTFGPFLIPATLFVVGVGAYAILWALTGKRTKWADESDEEGTESTDRDASPSSLRD